LTAGEVEKTGSFAFGEARSLKDLTPGSWTLLIELDGEEHELDLSLDAGAELDVVVTRDRDSGTWRVDLLEPELDPDAESARLFVLQRTAATELELDVGSDGSSDGLLAQNATSPQWLLDVTRPALSLLSAGAITHQFALPRPNAKTTVVGVLLGNLAAGGLEPQGLRLLVANMAREEVTEVRPNPQVYIVHASAAHAALDVFVSQGNPKFTPVQPPTGKVSAYSPDLSENRRRSVAEVADNLRFGELRVGRVPSGPISLDLYLSIPGDPQLPAPLSVDLIFKPLPNQRLRNGGAVGRQGTSHLGDRLLEGGQYLAIASATDLWPDNRSPFAPAAPVFPFQLLKRPRLQPAQFSLQVGSSITKDGTTAGIAATIGRDGEVVLETAGDFNLGPTEVLEAGNHLLTLSTTSKSASLPFQGVPGQNLLVIVAGDASPPAVVIQPQPWRSDDIDGDGAVASAQDPMTGAFLEPNYLAYDGNSELIQDDCPTEPGSTSHGGCPSPGLTWIVIDLAQQPPQVVRAPIN
jgi:hypothetical protein